MTELEKAVDQLARAKGIEDSDLYYRTMEAIRALKQAESSQ